MKRRHKPYIKNKVPGVRWRIDKNMWVVERGSVYVGMNKDWFEAVCLRKSAEAKHKSLMILSIMGNGITL